MGVGVGVEGGGVAHTWSSQHGSGVSQTLHAEPTTSCRDKRLCTHTPVYHSRQAMHQPPRSPLSRLMNCELVAVGFFFLSFSFLLFLGIS